MNNIYQQIVNQKLKTITPDELVSYGKEYQISINRNQAQKVLTLLRNRQKVNIFDANERKALLMEIAKVTSPQVARELNRLFIKFVK